MLRRRSWVVEEKIGGGDGRLRRYEEEEVRR